VGLGDSWESLALRAAVLTGQLPSRAVFAESMTAQALYINEHPPLDVYRMCPATDRKKVKTVGQCRSPKLLVRSTFGGVRHAPETG
jgi:hypothetical protein